VIDVRKDATHLRDVGEDDLVNARDDGYGTSSEVAPFFAGQPLPTRILVIEDQAQTGEVLNGALQAAGYETRWAKGARRARLLLETEEFDLVLADVRLPDGSGLDLCSELRSRSQTPVILVSSAGTPQDRIAGFEAGADDYVVKPFHLFELRKRIEAVLRRTGSRRQEVLEGPRGLRLHLGTGEVEYRGERLRLTRSEVGLLQALIQQPDRAHSPAELSGRVWGYESVPDANFVQQHISRLRRKLARLGADGMIETVYGMGYSVPVRASEPHRDDATG